jgi:hypothetical protein
LATVQRGSQVLFQHKSVVHGSVHFGGEEDLFVPPGCFCLVKSQIGIA